jgi:hypothetical protein
MVHVIDMILTLFDKLVEKLRYRLVKVASVAGKGRETASQLSQSRTFPPVQVVNDHWDVLPTASKSVGNQLIICSLLVKENSIPQ